MFVGSLLDASPGRVAFIIADALHLIETGNSIAHMRRVVDRLLALPGKGKFIAVDMVALFFAKFGHGMPPSEPINERRARPILGQAANRTVSPGPPWTALPGCPALPASRRGRPTPGSSPRNLNPPRK